MSIFSSLTPIIFIVFKRKCCVIIIWSWFKLFCSSVFLLKTGCQCLTNFLVARESSWTLKDKKLPIDLVFIDFSKFFDKVLCNRLLSKLSNMRIGGDSFMRTKDFLAGCLQKVWVNSKLSTWETVLSGMLQGTILGPLLFFL